MKPLHAREPQGSLKRRPIIASAGTPHYGPVAAASVLATGTPAAGIVKGQQQSRGRYPGGTL